MTTARLPQPTQLPQLPHPSSSGQTTSAFPQRMTTLHFDVTIDNLDLGSFTGIDGLTAQYEVKTYAEGGENGYVHQLPGRLSYGTVKLTRPLGEPTTTDTARTPLTAWFRTFAEKGTFIRHTASIIAFDGNRKRLAQWNFTGVWPVKYAGPSFSTDSGKVATEVFEFAHDGFTEIEPK